MSGIVSMNFDIRNIKLWITVQSINIYLILYIAIVYELPFQNNNIRLVIMLFLCLFALFGIFQYIFIKHKINRLYAVFLIYFIYIALMVLSSEGINTTVLISTLFFPIVFLSSYYVFNKTRVLQRVINSQFVLLIIFFVLYFYARFVLVLNNGLVINSVYYQVLLLPFVLLMNQSRIRNIGILLILTTTLFSMKRTALIAILISLFIYYLTKNREKLKKTVSIKKIFSIVTLIFILIYLNKLTASILGNDIIMRLLSVFDDNGAGRFSIVNTILSQMKLNSFSDLMLGHGYNATALVTGGLTAHNDFIEILYDFGVFGLLLYLAIYIVLIKYAITFKRAKFKYTAAFNASISMFLVISLFSHLIFIPTYVASLCLFWSVCICEYENERKYKS